MIKIELLGGARRSFPDGAPVIDGNGIALYDVLEQLSRSVPDGSPKLDFDVMLVALNGADSSALHKPIVHDGDTISIIPIVHGGQSRLGNITIIGLGSVATSDPSFIDSLRAEFPTLVIQIVRQRFVLGRSHASRVASVSLTAARRGKLLSQKPETDILMRFAGTTQISEAIKIAGMRPKEDAVLMVIGSPKRTAALRARIRGKSVRIPSEANAAFLRRKFGITRTHTSAVLSSRPLEDILVERSIILT